VSSLKAEIIDAQEQHTNNKGHNDQFYRQMIMDYLKQWGRGSKKDFLELLDEKLPNALSDKQKDDKVRNLLALLRRDGQIVNTSPNRRSAIWELT
jgi:ATP-dependent DNA helicase RecG